MVDNAIEILAYKEVSENCGECKGGGTTYDCLDAGCSIGLVPRKCKSCGGSGSKKIMWAVLKRFETPTCYATSEYNPDKSACINKGAFNKRCDGCDGYGKIEQSLKVGEVRQFALKTGDCKDCLNADDSCYGEVGEECVFEPEVIKAKLLEKPTFFTKDSEGVTMDRKALNQAKWINGHTEPEKVMSLPNGEYQLAKLEVRDI